MNVFITGGNGGIGRALAQHYLAAGCRLGICSRSGELVEGCLAYRANAAREDEMRCALNDFCTESKLDLLVLAAGAYEGQACVDAHFEAVALALELASEYLLRGGRVVLISSVAALHQHEGMSFYARTKGEALRMAESKRAALADAGLGLTCLLPGYIDTPALRQLRHGEKFLFLLSLHEATARMAGAIERGEARLVFPRRMALLMGLLRLWPCRWQAAMMNFYQKLR